MLKCKSACRAQPRFSRQRWKKCGKRERKEDNCLWAMWWHKKQMLNLTNENDSFPDSAPDEDDTRRKFIATRATQRKRERERGSGQQLKTILTVSYIIASVKSFSYLFSPCQAKGERK